MLTGGCQCGNVRYASEGETLGLYICHCRECRRQSASAFGMSLQVPRAGFGLTRGTPKWWTRGTDSGGRLRCAFCADCGSRLWHEPEGPSESVTIKAGSLDEPVDAATAVHIWVSRKLPGIVIPENAIRFPEEPAESTDDVSPSRRRP
ncbi:GFA family protein [Pendulispora brunnea]|uniref:GFA family protein n=1 Tax=Pendulispora brunnea TaxID=2905690 RepID=UPI00374DFD90